MLAINDKYRPDEAVFLPPQGLLAVTMAKPINVEGPHFIIIRKDMAPT